jgi:hypothetical protein
MALNHVAHFLEAFVGLRIAVCRRRLITFEQVHFESAGSHL